MKPISIDVVIPSYRLISEYLTAVIKLDVPAQIRVRYLIIADNPEKAIPEDLKPLIDNDQVLLVRNKVNSGASYSRNVGIEQSNADWILFLDDDVYPDKNLLYEYFKAVNGEPNEIGFFGITAFPKPINSFTTGLVTGDLMHFFEMAKYRIKSKCATTSNVIVKRSAIGNIRFSKDFPKKGGGEDFVFFLEVHKKTGKALNSLPEAVVYHNWWNQGKRGYRQFFRWCYVEFEIFKRYPNTTYYDFPNIAEMLLLGLPVAIVFSIFNASWIPLVCLISGVLTGEIISRFMYILWLKGFYSSLYVFEVLIVRFVTDFARVYGIIQNLRFQDLLKRGTYAIEKLNIHYFILSGFKFMCYLFFIMVFYLLFY